MDFDPIFLDSKIIHLSPVQSNNLEVKFLIKFLSRFFIKRYFNIIILKANKLTLFSNSYFNPISFFKIQIEISSEKELIFVLLDRLSSSIETFSFS